MKTQKEIIEEIKKLEELEEMDVPDFANRELAIRLDTLRWIQDE